tara:strand:- start:7218 stop:7643 length:426 start_codon:yes stop_codon:yes gene_type:complete
MFWDKEKELSALRTELTDLKVGYQQLNATSSNLRATVEELKDEKSTLEVRVDSVTTLLKGFAKYKVGDWVEYTYTPAMYSFIYTNYSLQPLDPEQEIGRISSIEIQDHFLYVVIRPNGEKYTLEESSIAGKITLPKPRKKK